MDKSSEQTLEIPTFSKRPSILLVVAPYYKKISDELIIGAEKVLEKVKARVETVVVPGALEIPTAISLACNAYDGFIAIGCVIRGETTHYDTVARESSHALSTLGLQGVCIGNAILTVESEDQAILRADPSKQDKGGGAALAVLHLLKIKVQFE
ncbi:MAG: 6,7-dimethyl-8-ribityllumazine synthase [Pseudomonadota bacterium]|nr:6,7-dimethyl-8-ribityllumazine synthase [Pseudomonadota bacterium]